VVAAKKADVNKTQAADAAPPALVLLLRQHVLASPSRNALALVILITVAVVVGLYRHRGLSVVFTITVYLLSLSTMKLSVKLVFAAHDGFHFPVLLSAAHLCVSASLSLCALLFSSQRHGVRLAIPTLTEFFYSILPLAFFMVVSIGCSNVALVFATAAFTEVVASATCVSTALMVMAAGLPYDRRLFAPLSFVVVGVTVSSAGEIKLSRMGLALCLVSCLARSAKTSMQQWLMGSSNPYQKYDPCTLLFWTSMPASCLMILGSLTIEGLQPYMQMVSMDGLTSKGLFSAILLSCLNATVLNAAQLFITQDLGAVGSQLAAQVKSVLTMCGGMVMFHESVTALEACGFALVLTGVYCHSRMEQQLAVRHAAEKTGAAEVKSGCSLVCAPSSGSGAVDEGMTKWKMEAGDDVAKQMPMYSARDACGWHSRASSYFPLSRP